MSISGRLDDVSIAEVMQFIHLGQRSGVLHVEGDDKAEVHFNAGRIVAAHGDRIQRLGELLVTKGIIDEATLAAAIERQRQSPEGRVLGEILLQMGVVSRDRLTEAVQTHISDTVRDVLSWRLGTFRFDMGEVRPIQGFQKSLGQLLPTINLNTQRVLIEAARILDEARRDQAEQETSGPGSSDAGTAAAEAARTAAAERLFSNHDFEEVFDSPTHEQQVYIASSDDAFVRALAGRLESEAVELRRFRLGISEPRASNGSRPMVLIDLGSGPSEAGVDRILESTGSTTQIAIADPAMPENYVSGLGAMDIVERDVEAIAARCLGNEEGAHLDPPREGLLARLRRLSSEIRSGALSANATLALLNTLAECSERSVLFSVREGTLRAIGGFGFSTQSGRPIVEVIRGLTIPLAESQALAHVIADLEPLELQLDSNVLPDEFTQLVGQPESGTAAVFPVSGTESVILLVYTDNGDRPVEELDLMTLAADQVGVAIENEFLRYRLAQH